MWSDVRTLPSTATVRCRVFKAKSITGYEEMFGMSWKHTHRHMSAAQTQLIQMVWRQQKAMNIPLSGMRLERRGERWMVKKENDAETHWFTAILFIGLSIVARVWNSEGRDSSICFRSRWMFPMLSSLKNQNGNAIRLWNSR